MNGKTINKAQKVIISVWLILVALLLTQFTGESSSDNSVLLFLVSISIVAFILFKVWAEKK